MPDTQAAHLPGPGPQPRPRPRPRHRGRRPGRLALDGAGGNKIEGRRGPPPRPCAARSTPFAIEGTVVIGEGEMDEAPMLYIGERVGAGGPKMDIAVDPLEGTTLTAKGGPKRHDGDRTRRSRQLPARAGLLHGQDRRGRRAAGRRGQPRRLRRGEHAQPGRRQEARRLRPGAVHAGPRPPRGDHRPFTRAGRPHHAHPPTATSPAPSPPACRTATSTSSGASAARRKASSPRRPCAAPAARCRAG